MGPAAEVVVAVSPAAVFVQGEFLADVQSWLSKREREVGLDLFGRLGHERVNDVLRRHNRRCDTT
jgi:hypothetical protein